jgi:hypothetical protein
MLSVSLFVSFVYSPFNVENHTSNSEVVVQQQHSYYFRMDLIFEPLRLYSATPQ